MNRLEWKKKYRKGIHDNCLNFKMKFAQTDITQISTAPETVSGLSPPVDLTSLNR